MLYACERTTTKTKHMYMLYACERASVRVSVRASVTLCASVRVSVRASVHAHTLCTPARCAHPKVYRYTIYNGHLGSRKFRAAGFVLYKSKHLRQNVQSVFVLAIDICSSVHL